MITHDHRHTPTKNVTTLISIYEVHKKKIHIASASYIKRVKLRSPARCFSYGLLSGPT